MTKADSSKPKEIELGLYRHNKTGNIYEVIGIALHSETTEYLVVYRAKSYASKHDLFARPYEMFVELVEVHGQIMPRFEHIERSRTHLA